MGRARRARRIAQTAAYGGGFGVAGIGAVGALGYALIKAEAVLARRAVGLLADEAPDDDATYGSGPGTPIELVVLGDSSAAGLGAEHELQTIGAILATGVSAFSGRKVRLTNCAVIGAVSADLDMQVANALDQVPQPDVVVILIGTNDITHRIDKSVAVRHLEEVVRRLRSVSAQVVVGTCPDLGAIKPVAQPLRAFARRWSRDMAAAQTVAVVEAGGRTVSLGDLLGPEFAEAPATMFAVDQFHPSPAGYARAAAALLPTVCSALGLLPEEVGFASGLQRGSDAGRQVRPVSRAATRAVLTPGTEVSPTQIAGETRGPLGRWAVVLHRVRLPFPGRTPDPVEAGPDGAATGHEDDGEVAAEAPGEATADVAADVTADGAADVAADVTVEAPERDEAHTG